LQKNNVVKVLLSFKKEKGEWYFNELINMNNFCFPVREDLVNINDLYIFHRMYMEINKTLRELNK